MKTQKTRLQQLEKTYNVPNTVYVIEHMVEGVKRIYDVESGSNLAAVPEGAHVLARVGFDISKVGER